MMREEELRQYFLGRRSASELSEDISGSVVQIDRVHSTVQIVDMREPFSLTRQHLISLCDAFIKGTLSPDALNTVAFALLASDTFEWDDDVTSEVLSDWSAPEINYELNTETINMHRAWLLGAADPPYREFIEAKGNGGNLMSMRTKTHS